MSATNPVRSLSSQLVPQGIRFDLWMSVLRQSLWPVTGWKNLSSEFGFDLQEATLGCLSSMTERIGPHWSHRTRHDVDASGDRCYLLFANQLPWHVSHHGRCDRFAAGDLVLVDSQGELETRAESGFQGVILKLPVAWVQTWLPDPDSLIGQRIANESKWGGILSPIVRQLTPDLAAAPPLPENVLVDQVGVMLALAAGQGEHRRSADLLPRIQDCLRERCPEPQLTAADVAESLGVPVAAVHHALASHSLTFSSELLSARVTVARQILALPSLTDLPLPEIARQAGFTETSQVETVVRGQFGRKRRQLRHSR